MTTIAAAGPCPLLQNPTAAFISLVFENSAVRRSPAAGLEPWWISSLVENRKLYALGQPGIRTFDRFAYLFFI